MEIGPNNVGVSTNIEQEMQRHVTEWHLFVQGRLEENLYQVPHDALVIVGAYGHGLIKELCFLAANWKQFKPR